MAEVDPLDQAVLSTLITAFLIRTGGKTTLTDKEWDDAIKHDSTLWVIRSKDDVFVALVPVEGAKA